MAPLYENMTPLAHDLLITTNISGTKIRERVKHGLAIDHLVPPSIHEYIQTHHIYG
jgi:nicotinic acid mononucleotide adenylyltransferase